MAISRQLFTWIASTIAYNFPTKVDYRQCLYLENKLINIATRQL